MYCVSYLAECLLSRGTALPWEERPTVNECVLLAWNTNQDDFFYGYMIKRLNKADKVGDVIRESSSYLERWIPNDAAFIEKQNWLTKKIQKRQPLWLDDSLFVLSVHPSLFLSYARALRAGHYFSLESHSTVLRRLYMALCLLMPWNNPWRAIVSYMQSTAISLIG